jgi:hypothetical protein
MPALAKIEMAATFDLRLRAGLWWVRLMGGGLAGRYARSKPAIEAAIASHLQERSARAIVANCSELKSGTVSGRRVVIASEAKQSIVPRVRCQWIASLRSQ